MSFYYLGGRRWNLSKKQKREFAILMSGIDEFCNENGISQSSSSDSYYFTLNGIDYRVSNHTIYKSNQGAYVEFGNQIRRKYHPDTEEEGKVYITVGKTRIIQIYNDLKAGYELDRRGYRKTK